MLESIYCFKPLKLDKYYNAWNINAIISVSMTYLHYRKTARNLKTTCTNVFKLLPKSLYRTVLMYFSIEVHVYPLYFILCIVFSPTYILYWLCTIFFVCLFKTVH